MISMSINFNAEDSSDWWMDIFRKLPDITGALRLHLHKLLNNITPSVLMTNDQLVAFLREVDMCRGWYRIGDPRCPVLIESNPTVEYCP